MKQALIFLLLIYSISGISQIIGETTSGGENFKNGVCLTDNERKIIGEQLSLNIAQLKKEGIIEETASKKIVQFGWPVRKSEKLNWINAFGISNYVDQNTTSAVTDYNCGDNSYNGHKGTDIFTWPFPWYLFENDLAEVVAAADGLIILKQDGNFDQNCQWQGAGDWNAIYIQHDDGSVAWYGHLKTNSLTTKGFGQRVEKGEFLGVIGSSGRSTGPHLHFEVYDDDIYNRAHLIDPYKNSCNQLNNESWWADQKPYKESRILALITHHDQIRMTCPLSSERTNFENTFSPGSQVILGSYYRDHLVNQKTDYYIINPAGDIVDTWERVSRENYNASWWNSSFNIPAGGQSGIWKFEADFLDQHVSTPFYVCSTTIDEDNDGFCADVDCDDTNPNINPEAEDIPNNGIDENCDGTEISTATKNSFSNDKISLYPNPATHQLFVNFEDLKLSDFQIYNSLGQIQLNGNLSNNSIIDLKNLRSGIFYISSQTTDNQSVRIVKRFIKE